MEKTKGGLPELNMDAAVATSIGSWRRGVVVRDDSGGNAWADFDFDGIGAVSLERFEISREAEYFSYRD